MQLVFENVAFYRQGWALHASGTFHAGIHLVCGPVGSGKSTLAMLASGLLAPDEGNVRLEGIGSSMLSLQFPEYHITGLTLAGEVASWGLETESILTEAGLQGREHEDPAWLSRGELKRLQIACALAVSRDLLILDEPFSSLDCHEKEALYRKLSTRHAGITLLFTHEPWYLPRVDEIWILESGRLGALGQTPGAIARWSGAPDHIRHLIASDNIPANISPDDVEEAVCRMHVSG
ncbi:MAG: ATP-binding cassette domain-containing protein [Methanoregulaceae archaeon]|nr:ATP-binding cassette domain-containing protein [Methanoregulaceae archaeon]